MTTISHKTLVPVGLVMLAAAAGWSISERWFWLQQAIQVQVSAINVRLAVMEQRLDSISKRQLADPHPENQESPR